MIARHWRGWTRPENADAYESLLLDNILPSIRSIPGCQGGYLLRKIQHKARRPQKLSLWSSTFLIR
jgi:hypothetical protein